MVRQLAGLLGILFVTIAHAQTIKKDLDGFETGMTLEDVQRIGRTRNCSPIYNGGGDTGFGKNYTCHTGGPFGSSGILIGRNTNRVIWIFREFQSDLAPDRVVQDACSQFKSDCVGARLGEPTALSDTLSLVIRRQQSNYAVYLVDQAQYENEIRAQPGPRGVPRL